jgi:hypothetical protein
MKRLLTALFVLFPGLAFAQVADVVGVRDNFIVAGLAAQKCNMTDRDRQEVHDRNFTIVSRRAMEAIMARSSGVDPEEARQRDLKHIEQLQDATFNLLRAEGCKSDKVKALLRMHRMHETIRF